MKYLVLNGDGVLMQVQGTKLRIIDGGFPGSGKPAQYVISPRKIDFDSIVVYGRGGNISIDAIRWLQRQNIQILSLDQDGKLLTTVLQSEYRREVQLQSAQYQAYEDSDMKLKIAKAIFTSKFTRKQLVLDFLYCRHHLEKSDFSSELRKITGAKTVPEIRAIEHMADIFYSNRILRVIRSVFENTRIGLHLEKPSDTENMCNSMLNFGYALLEAECIRAIHATGLDTSVGFLHDLRSGRNGFAHDMKEQFGFLIDLAVFGLIMTERIEIEDFIRNEDRSVALSPMGAEKIAAEVNCWLNRMVRYQNKDYSWKAVIQLKTREFSNFIAQKRNNLNFSTPSGEIQGINTEDIRHKILSITYADWDRLGYSKGSLYYMKKDAMKKNSLGLHKDIRERVHRWEKLVHTT